MDAYLYWEEMKLIHKPADAKESPFLEGDEIEVASLGRGYFARLLLGQGFFQDAVIASNRRIYYSGSKIGAIGGRAVGKVHGHVVIPLQEVSSFSVVTSQNLGCLAFAMLCGLGVIGGILGILLGDRWDRDEWFAFLVVSGVLALISWGIYKLTNRRQFLIASNSVSIGIDYQLYGLKEIHDFLRKLGPYLPGPHASWPPDSEGMFSNSGSDIDSGKRELFGETHTRPNPATPADA